MDALDPSMAQFQQRPLKGKGLQRRREAIEKVLTAGKILRATPKAHIDKELYLDYYQLKCEDITREKARIGGDWAVAYSVFTRGMRDVIR